jgi:polysaccharide export outer membrane protein
MYNKYLTLLFLIAVIICGTSCVNTKKFTYFNDTRDANIIPNAEDATLPIIQKNDILSVIITSLNAEASAVFNQSNNTNSSTVTNIGNSQMASGYLVNTDGYIQLPILGNIKVAGSTTKEVKESITATLLQKKLLIDPIVTIRHLNYEITVIGEVTRPTVINVPSEKISLLKALGLSGDITIFGKKNNVLLIREISGKRTVKRIDLTAADFLTSPYYYLQPNDVVYVEANKNKIAGSSAVKQTLPIVLSALSILLLALDRLTR